MIVRAWGLGVRCCGRGASAGARDCVDGTLPVVVLAVTLVATWRAQRDAVLTRRRTYTPSTRHDALRRLGWLTLVLAIRPDRVRAIVRITRSGMGCGDFLAAVRRANGFAPFERPDLIIEVTHRYIAAALHAGNRGADAHGVR